jgi:signal transduction histidine kinase
MAATPRSDADVLDRGKLQFTIESRILRELGERLVKQPEVALLELVKNAYDADASTCEIRDEAPDRLIVSDDGHGMTFKEFRDGWMRIGTSAKEASDSSREYGRTITGEKGIGRFAVRFLGKHLNLETVAFDKHRGTRTKLIAEFNWPVFDQDEDLGHVQVPYQLIKVDADTPVGTRLVITKLRSSAKNIEYGGVRTGAIGVVTPYKALLTDAPQSGSDAPRSSKADPGFSLRINSGEDGQADGDVAGKVLEAFVLRAVLTLRGDRLRLSVYRNGNEAASLKISDRYTNLIGPVYADIRYFPQRKGTFSGLSVDGRRAKTWVKAHSGVAVFDRTFRVHPYGLESDDWLSLSADTAKRERKPRSTLASKHFPMDEATASSTQLNYMLRLPYPQQLVGIVQVKGRRTRDAGDDETGLVASADREGFVNNAAFRNLVDVVRGAVEAIANVDRELQQELEEQEQAEALKQLRAETRAAIKEIENNPAIARGEKTRIVRYLTETQGLAERYEERSRARESSLEVMSLLGVVAGYMTHEFGSAFSELEKARDRLSKLARRDESFKEAAEAIEASIESLREFVTYSQGYIHGTTTRPAKPYQARTRLQRTARVFGKYASDRGIDVLVQVDADVMAPLVPVSLYDGIALNLFTNALKAVTAKAGDGKRLIAFRAWNEQDNHYLEVSDTGIGIPSTFRRRVFEPLFTTTATNRDPLGSGMGLGLSLVKRGVESFGGRVDVVDPPAGFTTCVKVRLPITEESE